MSGLAARSALASTAQRLARRAAADPIAGLVLRTGTLLLAYLVLERWLLGVARLPQEAYTAPVLATSLVPRFLADPGPTRGFMIRVAMLATLGFLVARRWTSLRAPWSELEGGALLRPLVAVPALLLAWAFACYDYNLYFGHAHLVDRLALAGLAGLVLWRPGFALPFVALATALIWQFNYPIGGYSVAEPFLLVRWLLIFCAFYLLRTLGTEHRAADFVFLAVTLIAASYLVAGLGKLRIDWFRHGDVGLLLPATYGNGWLAFLDPETVSALTRAALRVDPLLVAGTFVVECGVIVCLFRRRVLLFFLAAWPAFHLSAFALTGIFFWKWIVLELVLLGLLLARPRAPPFDLFSRPRFALSIPLIVGGTLWFAPVNLTWYDAPVSYVYRFQATGYDGRVFSLPPAFFAPYDYQFTLGALAYLSPHRQLPVTWGATRDERLTRGTVSVETVEAMERRTGRVFLDEARAARFDRFMETFVRRHNERGSKRTVMSVLRPPAHLWTFARADAYDGSTPIARVTIRQVTTVFDGTRYAEIGPREIRSIAIPASPAAADGTPPPPRAP